GGAEAGGVEIRNARPPERIAEHGADRAGALPVVFRQAARLEMASWSDFDLRRREKRIVERPSPLFGKEPHPIGHDPLDVLTNRKEPGVKRLPEFRFHTARVLM